jgi:hypothetical protein
MCLVIDTAIERATLSSRADAAAPAQRMPPRSRMHDMRHGRSLGGDDKPQVAPSVDACRRTRRQRDRVRGAARPFLSRSL